MSRSPETTPEISVVAPVYNEGESVDRLYREIVQALDKEGRSFEVVLVNDASDDDSLDRMLKIAGSDPRMKVLDLAERSGQSAALAAGIEHARGSIVVTLDADLQNDPGDIPMLLDRLDEFDIVSGIRAQRHDSWSRKLASRIGNGARRLVLGDPFTDIGCSLKAYRAEFLRDLPVFDGMHRFLPVLAQMRGGRATEVPVSHRPRYFGESKYGAVRGRFLRGIADLIGVRWLQRRWVGRASSRGVASRAEAALDDERARTSR